MASSLRRKWGWVAVASRSTKFRIAPARNAPRIASSPRRSARATNTTNKSTAIRTLISAVVSCSFTSSASRRMERFRRERASVAAATKRRNPAKRSSLVPVAAAVVEKSRVNSTTAAKSFTDEAAIVCWPSTLVAWPESLRTGMTRPSDVAERADGQEQRRAHPVDEPETTTDDQPEDEGQDEPQARELQHPASQLVHVDLQAGQKEEKSQPEEGEDPNRKIDPDPLEAVGPHRDPREYLEDNRGYPDSWEQTDHHRRTHRDGRNDHEAPEGDVGHVVQSHRPGPCYAGL